ncbi:MAG TPA: TIGR00282 family metallophosphoesterase [Clostridia bacterium]|nr:TIGR00282 family metallophosphoesterase [Clostridia bacterium]
MNILTIGDVVGTQGCEFVRDHLPALKKLKNIDICICNGENSAAGNGITPLSAEHLFASGVDFITNGNHVYRRREVYDFLDERNDVIRPANFYIGNPGKGVGVIDMGSVRVGVVNIIGKAYMDCCVNPFITIDEALKSIDDCKIKIVDFHAEATAEKRAMGFNLDGKVSVLFGTHTHVQTADEQILPNGTGYITDLGMTGPKHSVLGIYPETAISWQKTSMPARFEVPNVPCMLNGCIFEVDPSTGKTLSVERVSIE